MKDCCKKVGIILMAYNQGMYITEAIESLRAQTFQDFEVHLVDDGSNDGVTPGILETLDYNKISGKYLYTDNKGVAKRQLEQYKILNNKYILNFCADDALSPEFLEKTVAFLDKHKDYGAVSVDIRLFEKDINDCYAEKKYDMNMMKLPFVLARNRILGSSLMRKRALDAVDLSGEFVRYQDWDRWISMMEAGWKIGLVPEFLFYYRQVPTSLSHSASMDDEIEIREKLLKKHAKSYEKYYKDVIMDMERAFLEMQEGKNWLEKQYYSLNKEIKRLNAEVEQYENKCVKEMMMDVIRKIKRKSKNE